MKIKIALGIIGILLLAFIVSAGWWSVDLASNQNLGYLALMWMFFIITLALFVKQFKGAEDSLDNLRLKVFEARVEEVDRIEAKALKKELFRLEHPELGDVKVVAQEGKALFVGVGWGLVGILRHLFSGSDYDYKEVQYGNYRTTPRSFRLRIP